MKAIIEKMLECLLAFLPFLSKRSKKKVEKMKEFSELVREQYGFLVGQLEKVLQDYFGLSARVKEMHTEIFSLKAELQHPEMRRLMQLPGMRMADAYRLAHYEDALRQTAHAVEQGVVERIRQRASRPAENGTRPGSAAVTGADVSRMTRAQREALERKALHGEVITF